MLILFFLFWSAPKATSLYCILESLELRKVLVLFRNVRVRTLKSCSIKLALCNQQKVITFPNLSAINSKLYIQNAFSNLKFDKLEKKVSNNYDLQYYRVLIGNELKLEIVLSDL